MSTHFAFFPSLVDDLETAKRPDWTGALVIQRGYELCIGQQELRRRQEIGG
jgi:hypothetical protein